MIDFIISVSIAAGLGLLLGLDREIKHAPAGVRTFALVSMGSAAYTLLTLQFGQVASGNEALSVDPSRLIQGLVGGIGFLGAGAIIGGSRGSESHVRGIATGAAVWIAGAIGVACGLGHYLEAVAVTLLSLTLLVVTEIMQVYLGNRQKVVRDEEGAE